MTINGTKVSVFIRPLVPDRHVVVVQIFDVGRAREEPEEFVDDRAQVELLRRHERKAFRERKAHLAAEKRPGAGAGSIGLMGPLFKNLPKERFVLIGCHQLLRSKKRKR